jgi:hypothetical protein
MEGDGFRAVRWSQFASIHLGSQFPIVSKDWLVPFYRRYASQTARDLRRSAFFNEARDFLCSLDDFRIFRL